MNKEVIEQWVQALRSGEYIQGRRFLKTTFKNETRHCCLGVLAEIIDSSCWNHHGFAYDWRDNNSSCLPDDVWVDVTEGKISQRGLWERNDGGESFDRIADVIEWGILNEQANH